MNGPDELSVYYLMLEENKIFALRKLFHLNSSFLIKSPFQRRPSSSKQNIVKIH